MQVCDLLPQSFKVDFPVRKPVSSQAEAESCAANVRTRWKLGKDPVESVTQCLENHGALIVHYNEGDTKAFDGLSARVNGKHPLLIVNSSVPVDRLRFDLLHELGHILMDTSAVPDKRGPPNSLFCFSASTGHILLTSLRLKIYSWTPL